MAIKQLTRHSTFTFGQYAIARMAAQATERILAGEKLTTEEAHWARVSLNCVLSWARPGERLNGRIVFAAHVLEESALREEIRRR